MKTLTVIHTSSFVDLITNSSSELFVCDGRKSIDMIKEIVVKLLAAHDSIEGTDYAGKAFTGVFNEPETAKWHWNPYSVPHEISDEYERYTEIREYSQFGGYSSHENEEYKALQEKYWAWCAANTAADRRKYPYTTHPDKWKEIDKKETAAKNRIWKKYGIAKAKAYTAMYKEFLKQNEYPQAEIDRVDVVLAETLKKKDINYYWLGSFGYPTLKDKDDNWVSDPMQEACYFFDMALTHDLHIEKDAVLIYTESDNTAPYDIFAAMDNYLSARHIHLG